MEWLAFDDRWGFELQIDEGKKVDSYHGTKRTRTIQCKPESPSDAHLSSTCFEDDCGANGLYKLRSCIARALKPFLMNVIACKADDQFENKLKNALHTHKEALIRNGLTAFEQDSLYARNDWKWDELAPSLLQKLIIFFSIVNCTHASDWLSIQLQSPYLENSKIEAVKYEVERAYFEIMKRLDRDTLQRAIFEIRPFNCITDIAIRDLIAFFREKNAVNGVRALASESNGGTELKKQLLEAIKQEDGFVKGERDIDVQLRKILPKYTFLTRSRQEINMPNILVKNLVRCKDLDGNACKIVGPYFAWKVLAAQPMEVLEDATFDDLIAYETSLKYLSSTNPKALLDPKTWLDAAVLITALCHYYDFMIGTGHLRLQGPEANQHHRNISTLLKKLGQEVLPRGWTQTVKIDNDSHEERLPAAVINVTSLLKQKFDPVQVENEEKEDDSDLESLDQDELMLSIRKIAENSYKAGTYKEALDLHLDVLDFFKDKNDREAIKSHYNVAMCHWGLGNQEKAKSSFEAALSILAAQSSTETDDGQHSGAYKNLQFDKSALQNSSVDESSLIRTTFVSFLIENNQLKRAEEELSKFSDEAVINWQHHFELGNLYFKRSDYDNAIVEYDVALKFPHYNENLPRLGYELVLSAMATAYLKQFKYAKAYEAYQKISKQLTSKKYAGCGVREIEDVWYNLALALHLLKFESEAMKIHEELTKVWPNMRRKLPWIGRSSDVDAIPHQRRCLRKRPYSQT